MKVKFFEHGFLLNQEKIIKIKRVAPFFEERVLKCKIEENGFTQYGWGESITFSTKGACGIFGDDMKMSEIISDSHRETSF